MPLPGGYVRTLRARRGSASLNTGKSRAGALKTPPRRAEPPPHKRWNKRAGAILSFCFWPKLLAAPSPRRSATPSGLGVWGSATSKKLKVPVFLLRKQSFGLTQITRKLWLSLPQPACAYLLGELSQTRSATSFLRWS